MVRYHLPPEYATPARAYLQAFLGEQEVADAMYEVVEDVTYWGDDSLPTVLAAAHSVLISRVRVTGEAAASWLVDELGLAPDVAEAITGAQATFVEEPGAAPEPAATQEPATVREAAAMQEPADAPPPHPGETAVGPDRSEPMRIGFDDGPLPSALFEESSGPARGRLLAGLVVIAGLLAIAVVLLSR